MQPLDAAVEPFQVASAAAIAAPPSHLGSVKTFPRVLRGRERAAQLEQVLKRRVVRGVRLSSMQLRLVLTRHSLT